MSTQEHTFTWDGRQLTGHDDLGVLWTVASTSGWHDGASVDSGLQPKAQQDGSWDATPRRQARTITLNGLAIAPDVQTLQQAARRHAASSRRGVLAGSSSFGDLAGSGVLEDAPRFTPRSDTLAAWQLAVTLSDPLLYGPQGYLSTGLAAASGGAGLTYPLAYPLDYGVAPGVTPGALSVANAGTAAYWPRLRVDGPVTNPVVSVAETGDWIRYGGTVAAGQWLDIDCADRRVLLNGQVSHRYRVTFGGRWLVIPVGGASLSWTADTADPAATLHVWSYEGAWS